MKVWNCLNMIFSLFFLFFFFSQDRSGEEKYALHLCGVFRFLCTGDVGRRLNASNLGRVTENNPSTAASAPAHAQLRSLKAQRLFLYVNECKLLNFICR